MSRKVIVLTGGLGLIGLEYVDALTKQGATLIVIDIVAPFSAQKIIKEKISDSKRRRRIVYFQSDITNRAALVAVQKILLKRFRRVDVLINNAALNPKVEGASVKGSTSYRFENFSVAQWDKEMAVNLTGTMLCCQVFGGKMKKGGSIINIASTYGLVGPDQRLYPKDFIKPATYGTSKGAIVSLTKYLASYWGTKGIRVNCVAPGGVNNGQTMAFVKKYASRTPLRRMARKDEYNGIIIYLASEASSYATGSVFVVDGGWTAW